VCYTDTVVSLAKSLSDSYDEEQRQRQMLEALEDANWTKNCHDRKMQQFKLLALKVIYKEKLHSAQERNDIEALSQRIRESEEVKQKLITAGGQTDGELEVVRNSLASKRAQISQERVLLATLSKSLAELDAKFKKSEEYASTVVQKAQASRRAQKHNNDLENEVQEARKQVC